MSVSRRSIWVGHISLALGVILLVGSRSREDRFSCHLCRARKEVRTSSLVIWPGSRRETVSYHGRVGPDHGHDWWHYSYRYNNGIGGCLGGGVVCHPNRYRDGSTSSWPRA
jgi:hypothetical protein